jgi:type IV secretory pathway TrbL component
MRILTLFAAALSLSLVAVVGPVQAKGCIKGAVVGGAAGHYAGHHGVAGAAVGCAVGHHEAKKHERQRSSTPSR